MAVEKAQVSADDLLPILSFVLVQALTEERPAQTVEAAMSASASSCWLHEHVAIMEEFLLPHMMAGEQGYCLVTIQTALQHLSMLALDELI